MNCLRYFDTSFMQDADQNRYTLYIIFSLKTIFLFVCSAEFIRPLSQRANFVLLFPEWWFNCFLRFATESKQSYTQSTFCTQKKEVHPWELWLESIDFRPGLKTHLRDCRSKLTVESKDKKYFLVCWKQDKHRRQVCFNVKKYLS